MTAVRRGLLSFILASQAACSLAPPQAQPPALRSTLPLAETSAPGNAPWPDEHWWTRYGDSTLNDLIERAAAGAPRIATAEARLNAARESVRVVAAADGLRIDGKASAERQRLSDNGLFPPQFLGFHWYNQADLGLQASYSFDWWHKRRAAVEAAIDEARAAQAERSASTLSLASAVSETYFGWQADQARLALLREQLDVVNRRRKVVDLRVNAQLEAADISYQLDGEAAELRGRIVVLESSAQLRKIALAALLGISLDELPVLNARVLPSVSTQVPANVRIDLLARRPDISASRWRIEAAQRQLAVARAEFLPDVSVNALAALSSIDLEKLFEYSSRAPSFGAAVHLPIFDGGLLKAKYGARATELESAVATYNDTLVTAAKEVATQVTTLAQIDAQRMQQQAQISAAEKLMNVNAARTRQGLADIRPQLLATQSWLAARDSLIDLDAAALSADVNLNVALGGGFQTEPAQGRSSSTRE